MKVNRASAIFSLAVFSLAACTPATHEPLDMDVAVQKAETRDTQDALADFYERAAKDMQRRAEEHRLLLGQYEGKGYLYGNRAQDTRLATQHLMDIYNQAIAENLKMAQIHRNMAARMPCRSVGVPGKGNLMPCSPLTDKVRAIIKGTFSETGVSAR